MKTINDFNFDKKKALIRVDFNVPLNESFEVTDVNAEIELPAGSFRIYTDKQLHIPNQDIILSIEGDRLLENVELYPNPVESKLNVVLPDDVRNLTLKITDLSGRDVYSQSIMKSGKNTPLEVNIGHIPEGMYLLNIESDGGLFSKLIYKK